MPQLRVARIVAALTLGAASGAECARIAADASHSTGIAEEAFFKGQMWHVEVFPDDWCSRPDMISGKVCRDGTLKPRRGFPAILRRDLMGMLRDSSGNAVLRGPVNGWRAISHVQLQSVTCQAKKGGHYLWTAHGASSWFLSDPDHFAEVVEAAMESAATTKQCKGQVLRTRLVAADWTLEGWKYGAPGFAYWFRAQEPLPHVVVGEDMLAVSGEGRAVRAHLFTHQWPRKSSKSLVAKIEDGLTWHSGVVLEWDHGRFLTVAELNWRTRGRNLWYDDIDSVTRYAPDGYDAPYTDKYFELGMMDLPAKTVEEVQDYFKRYSAAGGADPSEERFANIRFPWHGHSADVHLRRNRGADLARYLVNYVTADPRYKLLSRSCQSFAADLYTFLTGDTVGAKSWPAEVAYKPHLEQLTQEPLRT